MYPAGIGEKLYEAVGPMLPFCKFGRHRSDCADVLLESIDMLHDWHINASRPALIGICSIFIYTRLTFTIIGI